MAVILLFGKLPLPQAQILRFLLSLEDEGLELGAINRARCVMSGIEGQMVGKHYVVYWFLRSVYEQNPPKSKYKKFSDVSLVFKLFKLWPDNKDLNLRDLGFKVAILILLITGHIS